MFFQDFKQQSIPEEQRSHFHCSRSPKSCIVDFIIYSNAAQSQGVDPNFGFNHVHNYIKQINAILLNNELH
jgi:hypothetical protein